MKVYLGKVRDTFGKDTYISGEHLWLTKHTWDCNWYWGFGYIGNKDLHTHFNTSIYSKGAYDVNDVFSETKIEQSDWYMILDLFKQAYSLRETYQVYYTGNCRITERASTLQVDRILANRIKDDMKTILDRVWDVLVEINDYNVVGE